MKIKSFRLAIFEDTSFRNLKHFIAKIQVHKFRDSDFPNLSKQSNVQSFEYRVIHKKRKNSARKETFAL